MPHVNMATKTKFYRSSVEPILEDSFRRSNNVLDKIYETRKVCQDTVFMIECGEDKLKDNLKKRQDDYGYWVKTYTDLVKRLLAEQSVIDSEQEILDGVLQKIDAKIDHHVLVNGTANGFSEHPVEAELRKELSLLRRSREKVVNKKVLYSKMTDKLAQNKLKLEQGIKDKTAALTIEAQVFNLKPRGAFYPPRPKKQGNLTPQTWLKKCEQLKLLANESIDCSKKLIRETTSECLQMSASIQDQARRVDLALRLRINGNRNELADLEWRSEEINDELDHLQKEAAKTDNILIETMEQLKQLEHRKLARHIIPPPEMFQDDTHKIYKSEISNVKQAIKKLSEDLVSNQKTRDLLEGLLSEVSSAIEEKTQIIAQDEQRLEKRCNPPLSSYDENMKKSSSCGSSPRLSTIEEES